MNARRWVLHLSLVLLGATACDDVLPRGEAPARPADTADPTAPGEPGADATAPPEPEPPPDPLEPVYVARVEPGEGPVSGGIDVMIEGTGFRDGLEVLFEETPAPEVFVLTRNTAIVRLPPHPAGRVDVTVLHPLAPSPSTLPASFRFSEPIRIVSLTPDTSHFDGGEPVAVTGRGFTPDTRVFIDGRPLRGGLVIDPTLIRGLAPPGPFGRVDVHAVGFNGSTSLRDAFTYLAPPRLSALSPVAGLPGDPVVLHGEALDDAPAVYFGDLPATVVEASRDGTHLEVLAPDGEGLVAIQVQTRSGVTTLERAFAYFDPTAEPTPGCAHFAPDAGPDLGGTRVELACATLGAAPDLPDVRFGDRPAALIEAAPGHLAVTSPPGSGRVPVTVDGVTLGYFDYQTIPLTLTSTSPSSGPLAGGTRLSLTGRGITAQSLVLIGGLPATELVANPTGLTVTTPPGLPGLADVVVRNSGFEARLSDAFDYRSDSVSLALVTPARVARAGGTWLRLIGEGFDDTTTVEIGGLEAPIAQRVSSAELFVLSPRLDLGLHDAKVVTARGTATLPRAVTAFDPRSGTGGTWGDPIDGTLNVTVWGANSYGPVEGAFVQLGLDAAYTGLTNDEGQVTLSAPDLFGPVELTASAAGFTSYSVLVFDAENVTVTLQPTSPPSSGGGASDPPPPNAIFAGEVTGLDKYVVAPPPSCDARESGDHCAPCGPESACTDGFACVPLASGSSHCLAPCEVHADCPADYACGATSAGPRCLPSPGTKRAYCNISSPSLFGYEYPIQARGWIDDARRFELDSQRLGEVAVYCFGGYDDGTTFTPTALGVARNLDALSGRRRDDLKIELSLPLRRPFRFRLQDPPPAPGGLAPPTLVISLDLGPDGVIPFSRNLIPQEDPTSDRATWLAPNQLESLSGPVYDAHYFLYTTLMPAASTGLQPRSFNLVQQVRALVEDRLPVFEGGRWRLEGLPLEADLHALWSPPDEPSTLWAIGDAGLILRWDGVAWTRQSSPTRETLFALAGRDARDLWAVGKNGTVLRWQGLGWTPVAAPSDDYFAVHVTPTHVYAAGRVRLRVLDRGTGTWDLGGAPLVQEVRGFVDLGDTLLALGSSGRIYALEGDWTPMETPTEATLRAGLVRRDGSLVIVGDGGTLLAGPTPSSLARVPLPGGLTTDLTALVETEDGLLHIVGDDGLALSGLDVDALASTEIPDYRSRASAIAAMPTGELRVVGGTAFILGPFLHFPTLTAPAADATADPLHFAWTTTGPAARYTRLAISPEGAMTSWVAIVDGPEQSADLPDLTPAGLSPLGPGRHRLDLLRVLNPDFDIDGYSTRDFSIYAREAWSTTEAWFFVP